MATFYENHYLPITTQKRKSLAAPPHLHNHLEVVYLLNGASGTVCDEKRQSLKPGDIFISFPNQVHSYPPEDDEKTEHILIIFSPFVCSEFKDLFHQMTPISSVVPAKDLDPDISELVLKIYEENHKDSPYHEATTRGYLIAFLGKLFSSMEFQEEKKSDGTLLKSILNYCNKHYTEQLSLERLSQDLNAGKYYISHIFNEKLKISFPDYVNGLRINDAIRQLSSAPDIPITDIAYDCGFSSTRTFNRAFIKYTGMTPRDYREKNRDKKVAPLNFYVTGSSE